MKYKTCRLLVVVRCEDYYNNNEERHNVPDEYPFRDPVEEMRAVNVDDGRRECDQICEQNGMPSLNSIVGEAEVGLSQYEVCSNAFNCKYFSLHVHYCRHRMAD